MIKNIFLIPVLLLVAVLLVVQGCGSEKIEIPTDDKLRNEFYANASYYHEVKSVLLSEGVYRVELFKDQLEILPKSQLENSERRLQLSKMLSDKLHVNLVSAKFKGSELKNINEVSFYNYRSGYAFGGQTKGVAYLVSEPSSSLIIENLDLYRAENWEKGSLVSGQRVYSPLIENWYLFYEYSD